MSPTLATRADKLLVARGLFESRARAQAAIEAGLVSANGAPVRKASELVPADAQIESSASHPYVSRGGVKLAAALDAFAIDPLGQICLDVGSSTGGFTDVLLKRGAAHVFAIDTGRGQIHASLHGHDAITLMEGVDVRTVLPGHLTCHGGPVSPAFAVIDVSFISLTLVLPAVAGLLAPAARIVALVKPQFEVGRGHIGKNGLVKDESARLSAVVTAEAAVTGAGFRLAGQMQSPITGGEGNVEYLVAATRGC